MSIERDHWSAEHAGLVLFAVVVAIAIAQLVLVVVFGSAVTEEGITVGVCIATGAFGVKDLLDGGSRRRAASRKLRAIDDRIPRARLVD